MLKIIDKIEREKNTYLKKNTHIGIIIIYFIYG